MSALSDSTFISTREASELSGYHSDYLGRLCRSQKIIAKRDGRAWLIQKESLLAFAREQVKAKESFARALSKQREQEYHAAQKICRNESYAMRTRRMEPIILRPVVAALAAIIVLGGGLAFEALGLRTEAGVAFTKTVAFISKDGPVAAFAALDVATLPDAVGVSGLATGVRLRDEFSTFLARAVRTEIALGNTFADISAAILALHESVLYAWVKVTPEVPEKALAAVYDIGDGLTLGAEGVVRASAIRYVAIAEHLPSYDVRPLLARFESSYDNVALGIVGRTAALYDGTRGAATAMLALRLREPASISGSSLSAAAHTDAVENIALGVYYGIRSLFDAAGTSIAGLFLRPETAALPAQREPVVSSDQGTHTETGSSSYSLSGTRDIVQNVNHYYSFFSGVTKEYVDERIGYLLSRQEDARVERPGTAAATASASVDLSTISGSTITSSTFEGTAVDTDALTVNTLNGPLQAIGGIVSATSTIRVAYGGTGHSGYAVGDLLYADSASSLTRLPVGSTGQVLKVSGGVPMWGADATGSGGTGVFATSSDSLSIYQTDVSDVVIIGASATTTTGNILEVAGAALFRSALTAYNTVTAPVFTATSTTATSTFPLAQITSALRFGSDYLTDLTGSGLQITNNALTLNATGDWTGTFDGQEGSYYLSRANHTGTQLASTISDFNSAVNSYIHSSTTIPKTYTANTFTGPQTFNTGLTLGTLNGPLQANNGVISATTSIGVLYGGTGLTTAPTYGQLLVGNSSGGYTLTATSSLGLASVTSRDWELTTNTFGQSALAPTTTQNIAISGTGTSTFAGGLEVWSQIAAPYFQATSTIGTSTFAGAVGIGTSNPATQLHVLRPGTGVTNTVLIQGGNAASTGNVGQLVLRTIGGGGGNVDATLKSYYTGNNYAFALDTNNIAYPIVLAATTASNVGIGTSSPYARLSVAGQVLADNFTATSTTATSTFPLAQITSALRFGSDYLTDLTGSGLQITNNALTLNATGDWTGTFDGQEGTYYLNRANHTGTQTASTISDFAASVNSYVHSSTTIPKTYTTNTFTGANVFSGGLTVGTLDGPLQANGGVISATTSIGVLYGGTGLTSSPTYGQLLVGNSSGGYTLTATSSLGLPTFAYPFPSNATSTMLTFNGGLLSIGSTTINGNATTTGDFSAGGVFTVRTNGNVGIGTTSPGASLSMSSVNPSTALALANSNGREWRVASIGSGSSIGSVGSFGIYDLNAAATRFLIDTSGNVGIGTTTPSSNLSIVAAGSAKLQLADSDSGAKVFELQQDGNLLKFDQKGVLNVMSLDLSTGNVGIGTSSPGYKLDVYGTSALVAHFISPAAAVNRTLFEAPAGQRVEIHQVLTGNQDWVMGVDGGDSNKWKLASADDGFASAKLTVTTTGNVSVSGDITASSFSILNSSSVFTGDQGGSLEFHSSTASAQPYIDFGNLTRDYDFRFQYVPTSNMLTFFSTTTSNILTIGTSKVGIGLAAPRGKLDVVSSSQANTQANSGDGSVRFTTGTGSNTDESLIFGVHDGDYSWIQAVKPGTSQRNLLLNPNGGNVGIATTSPWRTFSVTGTVGFDGLTGAVGAGSLCLSSTKQVTYNAGSDNCLSSTRATKHDIRALDVDALTIVNTLQPVSFVYNGTERTRYGFIAEDTAAIDEILTTYNDQGDLTGIDDRSILSVVVKAFQSFYTMVISRLAAQDSKIEILEARIRELEAREGMTPPESQEGTPAQEDTNDDSLEDFPEEVTPDTSEQIDTGSSSESDVGGNESVVEGG